MELGGGGYGWEGGGMGKEGQMYDVKCCPISKGRMRHFLGLMLIIISDVVTAITIS